MHLHRNVVVLGIILLILIISCSHTSGKNRRYSTEIEDLSVDNSITIIGHPDSIDNVSMAINSSMDAVHILCRPAPLSGVSEQIIKKKAYIVSYNKDSRIPNWVAWHLIAQHVDGDIPRSNDYREDFDVPAPRATNEDYKGSGWSRGHMCPAGDNKWDATAMSESFLLSNMCPQDASLNSGVWNKIEFDCRQWAKKYGDLYIVCGPLFLNREHESIGVNKVVVPEAFFKVILCLQGSPKGIGFIVRNNEGKKKRDSFVNTIDDVERVTGMDFFPSLPDSIESVVEGHANIKLW